PGTPGEGRVGASAHERFSTFEITLTLTLSHEYVGEGTRRSLTFRGLLRAALRFRRFARCFGRSGWRGPRKFCFGFGDGFGRRSCRRFHRRRWRFHLRRGF